MLPFPKPRDKEGRVRLSDKQKRAQLDRKIQEQGNLCWYCRQPMNRINGHVRQATRDHVTPRGMGAGSIDDSDSNIVAACNQCNVEKGSKRGWTKGCNIRRSNS